jgi:hypothetical protein
MKDERTGNFLLIVALEDRDKKEQQIRFTTEWQNPILPIIGDRIFIGEFDFLRVIERYLADNGNVMIVVIDEHRTRGSHAEWLNLITLNDTKYVLV